MAQTVDRHLVKAVVDMSVFFEFTPSSVLDPDASVSAMEQLAFELSQMSDDCKNEFIRAIKELAIEYGDKAEFVAELPIVFGLSEGA
jgi:hypothetical protein